MKNIMIIFIFSLAFIYGCTAGFIPEDLTSEEPEQSSVAAEGGADGAPVSDEEFNYQTSKWVSVTILTDYSEVPFDVYDDNNKLLISAETNSKGSLSVNITVPQPTETLYAKTSYIGMPGYIEAEIENDSVNIDLRYSNNKSSRTVFSRALTTVPEYQSITGLPSYKILGSWNSNGFPQYLNSRKAISPELLAALNEAVPEYQPVPEYRPQYLMDTVDTDLHMTENGEVFVTFIHEGAGYKNSLGYYTYITADGPPATVYDEDITIIFPNVSYFYGGGELKSGDTVKIGTFEAGTSIGWTLISNAYSTIFYGVTTGLNKFYSENNLNPDASPYKQHIIQLDLDGEIVLGIEDLVRPGGDNDFNDAIFTVSSNPVTAINRTGLVTDTTVHYTAPEEPADTLTLKEAPLYSVTGYQFFPGRDEFGTLAYEDLWPWKGDYDFNDLVVDYNVIEALDADNNIVQIQLSLKIVGIIASMHNGFGIRLGVAPELVASVSGALYTKGEIELADNGTELRQQKAVIIVFEDAQAHYNAESPDDSELIEVSINFVRGVTRSELGFAPYNPFIMSNGERGREVHLPGYQPTSLVHIPYFGSEDDDSVMGTTFVYKTTNDLPWALHLPEPFAYPFDSIKIYDAYNLFQTWVDSDGFSFSDWYMDKSDYRNLTKIMRIP